MTARKRKRWTPAEDAELKRRYPDTPSSVLAEDFGRGIAAIYQRAYAFGLNKSAAFQASETGGRLLKGHKKGTSTRFVKGQPAWNKGMKGLNIGGVATRFKPGLRPASAVAVGTVIVNDEGYQVVKIAEPKHWEFLHRQVWQTAHGPIAPGLCLTFRDRNKLNCALDNLELLTRNQLMARNTIHNYPPELKHTIRVQAKLTRMINEKL